MKKIISLLTAFVMLLSVTAGLNLTVYAQTQRKSKIEAMEWVKYQVGQSIDFDKQNGSQCVDLIMAYYNFLGEKRGKGNAVDYVRNKIPECWERIKDAKPKTGDVLIYAGDPDIYYGHLGIYESKNSSYHQANGVVYNTSKPYYTITSSRGAPYWGVIRPVFSDDIINECTSETTVIQPNNSISIGLNESTSLLQTIQTTQKPSFSVESKLSLLKPTINSITVNEYEIKFLWKKDKNADGYQVKYSANKNIKSKSVKLKTVNNKCVIKIRSNRKYYAMVRAYKKTGNKIVYSKWSKKVRIY